MGSTCGIVELVSAAELPAGMQVKDSGEPPERILAELRVTALPPKARTTFGTILVEEQNYFFLICSI
jgi:hypothetical protein